MKDQFFRVMSILAIASYFVPLLIVLGKQLWQDVSFRLFSLYWFIGGLINIVDWVPGLSLRNHEVIGVMYNMLDIPFILSIFYFTGTDQRIRKFILFAGTIYTFVVGVNILTKGFRYEALKYMLGLGIFIVLLVVIWNILGYIQKMRHTRKQRAMLFIYSALLFQFGTFVVIYIFDYFITDSNQDDNFLMYYISSLVAIGIACCGLLAKGINSNYLKKSPRIG